MKNRYEKEKFSNVVKNSLNLSDVARKIGLTAGHGNRQTIKKYIEVYKLDTSHFIFSIGNEKNFKKRDTKSLLVKGCSYGTTHLKNRLIKEGLKEKKCEICGQDENWKGEKLTFILDHINGDNRDHRIENLRILCPNCSSVLDTNCGKNVGKYNIKSKENFCECGKKISKKSKSCNKCFSIINKKNRPSYGVLINEVEKHGYSATGRKFGVSGNTIKKWTKTQYVT